jgi:colanic acid/amylovoran biosynthesis glycosyltransferase
VKSIMSTEAADEGKLGFFFPVYGFEHQRYLENRIRLMQDRPYHVVCLLKAPECAWGIPPENVSILFSRNIFIRLANKAFSLLADCWLQLLGRKRHSIVPPLGWKTSLRRVIKEQGIKAFLVFYGGSAALVGTSLKKLGVPFAVLFEGSDFQVSDLHPWYRKGLERAMGQAERCVFVSNSLKRQAMDRGFAFSGGIVAYNGTHVPQDSPSYRFSKPVNLVSIGNLFPVKGHDYLLEGFHSALASEPGMRLTIIGGGGLEGEYRRRIKDWGIEGKVRLTGALPWKEAQGILAQAHIFLLMSVRAEDGQEEALPLAAIEAQSLGKPAIVSDSGGLPEVVENGQTGLVVPQRNADAICRAILDLVSKPGRLAAMSRSAHERALRLFTIEGQASELRGVRDALLGFGNARIAEERRTSEA